jgi:hypothetical protein
MPDLSENQLSELTGRTRATIRKRMDGLEYRTGPHKARLYDSKIALEAIYLRGSNTGESDFIDTAEAQRQLTVARRDQITLEMECTRKDRIPLDDIEAVNDRVFTNVAGLLKAQAGKVLSPELLNDLFTELRGLGDSITK